MMNMYQSTIFLTIAFLFIRDANCNNIGEYEQNDLMHSFEYPSGWYTSMKVFYFRVHQIYLSFIHDEDVPYNLDNSTSSLYQCQFIRNAYALPYRHNPTHVQLHNSTVGGLLVSMDKLEVEYDSSITSDEDSLSCDRTDERIFQKRRCLPLVDDQVQVNFQLELIQRSPLELLLKSDSHKLNAYCQKLSYEFNSNPPLIALHKQKNKNLENEYKCIDLHINSKQQLPACNIPENLQNYSEKWYDVISSFTDEINIVYVLLVSLLIFTPLIMNIGNLKIIRKNGKQTEKYTNKVKEIIDYDPVGEIDILIDDIPEDIGDESNCGKMYRFIDVTERVLFYDPYHTTDTKVIAYRYDCLRRYEDYWDTMAHSSKGYYYKGEERQLGDETSPEEMAASREYYMEKHGWITEYTKEKNRRLAEEIAELYIQMKKAIAKLER